AAKSSAAPIVRTQLLRLPSATRMTQPPPLLLRRYPSPRPFATRMNVGLIDTGNFNRAERVSRVDERIALAMPYPAFILPTYADKGECRRTIKSRWNAILSAYRVRLRPPTSGYSQRISSKILLPVVIRPGSNPSPSMGEGWVGVWLPHVLDDYGVHALGIFQDSSFQKRRTR